MSTLFSICFIAEAKQDLRRQTHILVWSLESLKLESFRNQYVDIYGTYISSISSSLSFPVKGLGLLKAAGRR